MAQAQAKKRTRLILGIGVGALIVAALAAAFWPRPVLVDLGQVARGAMRLTIDEEGRTEVSEPYVVSTPVAGRLLRVEVDPGERVARGETVIARMRPTNPAVLDIRTREQALAGIAAAEAAERVAQADLNAAGAARDLAERELGRTERLVERQVAGEAALDKARQEYRVAEAQVETAEAAIAMRRAELANARAMLIRFDDAEPGATLEPAEQEDIPVYAPSDGRILRIIQRSETTLPAGAPILEIGDVEDDLEVVVELISSDAVQVALGDTVLIEEWGGPQTLIGEVTQIDPFGVTKTSALGVEEQRVPVTVALRSPAEERVGLGHGYRVEARIVIWERADALRAPASALFRAGEGWAVFALEDGRAVRRAVEIGRNNGVYAEVLSGLGAGDRLVLYPSAAVSDGTRVAEREIE